MQPLEQLPAYPPDRRSDLSGNSSVDRLSGMATSAQQHHQPSRALVSVSDRSEQHHSIQLQQNINAPTTVMAGGSSGSSSSVSVDNISSFAGADHASGRQERIRNMLSILPKSSQKQKQKQKQPVSLHQSGHMPASPLDLHSLSALTAWQQQQAQREFLHASAIEDAKHLLQQLPHAQQHHAPLL